MDYIRFDVGHCIHVCHRDTLLKFQESTLARMVAPEFDTRKTEHEHIMIDRSGKHFGSILNYMRNENSLNLERWTCLDLDELEQEADFYNLCDLIERCQSQIYKKSGASVVSGMANTYFVIGEKSLDDFLYSLKELAVIVDHRRVRNAWDWDTMSCIDPRMYEVYLAEELESRYKCFIGLWGPEEKRFLLSNSQDNFKEEVRNLSIQASRLFPLRCCPRICCRQLSPTTQSMQ